MAQVAGRPFLEHLLGWLAGQGVCRVILALGYLHQQVQAHFGSHFEGMTLEYSIEETPAGTGGALSMALSLACFEEVFLVNGDTFFAVPLSDMIAFHRKNKADLTMALKSTGDISRYGGVELRHQVITAFREKGGRGPGYINGGLLLLNRSLAAFLPREIPFSLERDVFPEWLKSKRFYGYPVDGFFIDIGVPQDYSRACRQLPRIIRPTC